MNLQPAYETTLLHGDHAVTLRASLRAAAALNDLPGGIPRAWESLMRQSYSGIRAVILATATDKTGALKLLASLSDKPLAPFVTEAQAACLDLMQHLLPAPSETPATGAGMPWGEFVATIFKHATAYLEWSPSETWNASLNEIEAAISAHGERIGLQNGGEEQLEKSSASQAAQREANEKLGLDPDFDRHGLQELKALF